jgi:hypothetical protein
MSELHLKKNSPNSPYLEKIVRIPRKKCSNSPPKTIIVRKRFSPKRSFVESVPDRISGEVDRSNLRRVGKQDGGVGLFQLGQLIPGKIEAQGFRGKLKIRGDGLGSG